MKETIEKVKQAFEKSGWTFEGLAINSGVPEQTIKNIIKGRTADPRFETIHRLTEALAAYIGDPAEEAEKHAESQPQKSPDDYRESLIAALYERIDVDEQRYKEKIADIRAMYEKEIVEIKELYCQRIEDEKESAKETIRMKSRWICILAASIAALIIFIGAYIIFDIKNPEMGIFRFASAAYQSDFSQMKMENPNMNCFNPYLDSSER